MCQIDSDIRARKDEPQHKAPVNRLVEDETHVLGEFEDGGTTGLRGLRLDGYRNEDTAPWYAGRCLLGMYTECRNDIGFDLRQAAIACTERLVVDVPLESIRFLPFGDGSDDYVDELEKRRAYGTLVACLKSCEGV